MTITQARELIANASISVAHEQTWLDLGCGSGTFTLALAGLLPQGSRVIGIDRQHQKLGNPERQDVRVLFRQGDMQVLLDDYDHVNGILLGNSLHYVRDQPDFLVRLLGKLLPEGRLIIIEYDTVTPSPWVPYPMPFRNLNSIVSAGAGSHYEISKLGERPSMFRVEKMYGCEIRLKWKGR